MITLASRIVELEKQYLLENNTLQRLRRAIRSVSLLMCTLISNIGKKKMRARDIRTKNSLQ